MDKDKFKDVRVRQAMAYAIDRKEIGEKLYHGLRYPANSPIPPSLPKYHNNKIGAYDKDVEKAKKLLDEAGYKDTNGDGFREDPNGKEFKANFLSMSGSDVSEPLAKFFIQSWKDIGLKVELLDGRLHEFNSFYDMIKKMIQRLTFSLPLGELHLIQTLLVFGLKRTVQLHTLGY